MPGVADQIRKTNLKHEQQARKKDMEELILMVKEGRLNEADERQIETLKLSLELNQLLSKGEEKTQGSNFSAEEVAKAVQQGVVEALKNLPVNLKSDEGFVADSSRPSMRHTSLNDLKQVDEKIKISGDLDTASKDVDGGSSKLNKLKKLKGNG